MQKVIPNFQEKVGKSIYKYTGKSETAGRVFTYVAAGAKIKGVYAARNVVKRFFFGARARWSLKGTYAYAIFGALVIAKFASGVITVIAKEHEAEQLRKQTEADSE